MLGTNDAKEGYWSKGACAAGGEGSGLRAGLREV